MNGKYRQCLPAVLLLIIAVEGAAQPEPKTPAVPARGAVVFRAGWAPTEVPGFHPCESYLRSVAPNKDAVLEARGVEAWMLPRRVLWVKVNYAPLKLDDIVPVFGQLHQVTDIQDRGEPKGNKGKDWIMMAKVQEKNMPAGVTFQEGSIGAPLAGSASFDLGRIVVGVTKIEAAATDDNRGAVAEVTIYNHEKLPAETVVKLRRGDTLAIRDGRYKVLNVVPRDEKTHVIGWVELAP